MDIIYLFRGSDVIPPPTGCRRITTCIDFDLVDCDITCSRFQGDFRSLFIATFIRTCMKNATTLLPSRLGIKNRATILYLYQLESNISWVSDTSLGAVDMKTAINNRKGWKEFRLRTYKDWPVSKYIKCSIIFTVHNNRRLLHRYYNS